MYASYRMGDAVLGNSISKEDFKAMIAEHKFPV